MHNIDDIIIIKQQKKYQKFDDHYHQQNEKRQKENLPINVIYLKSMITKIFCHVSL